ncbi:MAG: hypothetical protein JWN38_453 [Candidatus Saccharibacteria bacterium]|nr:hypothetical protein [Candidatus Saccharibacteria bacterium]
MAVAMDATEIFSRCLAQATFVVKQVLPSHYANPTPDADLDVEDLTSHMLAVIDNAPAMLSEEAEIGSAISDGNIDHDAIDLSARWQMAADRAELAVSDADPDETIAYNKSEVTVEDYLLEAAGDLLIHAWDLGEAIGMPVRFDPNVAEAIIETVGPSEASAVSRDLFDRQIEVPANADLQTRLLAIFGRTRSWRGSA